MILKPYIREKRMEAHLTQTELAQKLDIDRSHLSALEKGKYLPSITIAFQISHFCNCKVDDLFIVQSM